MAKIVEFPIDWQTRSYQLFDGQEVISDRWEFVSESEAENLDTPKYFDLTRPILFPLSAWFSLSPVNRPTGFWLQSDTQLDNWALDLRHVKIIAIAFPRAVDGRGYSIARQLRETYGFTGTIRAIGEVRIDQLANMREVGFDQFALSSETNIDTARDALNIVPHRYLDYNATESAGGNHFQRRHSA